MKRDQVLDKVKQIICKDRNNTHGEPENTFPMIAEAWTRYLKDAGYITEKELTAFDVALMMADFKRCRLTVQMHNPDNINDMIGYLAIAAELAPIQMNPIYKGKQMDFVVGLNEKFPVPKRAGQFALVETFNTVFEPDIFVSTDLLDWKRYQPQTDSP